jgi:hypothetical protein
VHYFPTRRSSTTSRSSAPRFRSGASTRCGAAATATGASTTAARARGRGASHRRAVRACARPLRRSRTGARGGCCCHARDSWRVTGPGSASSPTTGTGVWELRRGVRGAPVLLLALPLLGVARLFPADGFGSGCGSSQRRSSCCCPARSSRGRCGCAARRRPSPSASARSGPRWCSSSSCTARSGSRSSCSRSSRPSRCRSHLRVVSGPPRGTRSPSRFGGLVLGVLLWHVAGRRQRRRTLPPRPWVRKLVELGDLHLRTVDSSATAVSIPATPSRSGTGSSRSSRSSPASTRRRCCCTSRARSCRSRSPSCTSRASPYSGPPGYGLGVLAATVTAAAFAPGHGGSYTLLAQTRHRRPLRARARRR